MIMVVSIFAQNVAVGDSTNADLCWSERSTRLAVVYGVFLFLYTRIDFFDSFGSNSIDLVEVYRRDINLFYLGVEGFGSLQLPYSPIYESTLREL